MHENMAQACDHKEPEQSAVFDISFNTVENVLRQINEKENIEYLLDRVFEYGKDKKEPVRFPYLFHGIHKMPERTVFCFHINPAPFYETNNFSIL
jgi:hypothetical protein